MKSLKVLTIATLAIGCCAFAAPKASAWDQVITQPAVLDNSCGLNTCGTVMTQPAVIDNSCNTCGSTVLSQPAVFDNSCNTCGTVLSQPAVIDNSCNTCGMPSVIETVPLRRRHHLLGVDTPFFGMSLF